MNPNAVTPPSRLTKINRPFIEDRPLMSAGRSRLSSIPTIPTPMAIRISPRIHEPERMSHDAAGSQTSAVPNTGTSAQIPMTTPQKTGALMPRTANAIPPATPCAAATASMVVVLAYTRSRVSEMSCSRRSFSNGRSLRTAAPSCLESRRKKNRASRVTNILKRKMDVFCRITPACVASQAVNWAAAPSSRVLIWSSGGRGRWSSIHFHAPMILS